MPEDEKQFHISDVLSITTSTLVSTRLMSGVYDILNFMTSDNLFTHQLPRAAEECRPYLLEQFQQLKDVDASDVTKDTVDAWLQEQIDKFGEMLTVRRIPKEAHLNLDPIDELVSMVGEDRVVIIEKEETH